MSKTSWFLVFVMCTALCYMGAVRIYQFYQRQKEAYMERQMNDGNPFTFQRIPIARPDLKPEPVALPVEYVAPRTDIFLEEPPLAQEQQDRQAHDTISSIIDDFRGEEVLQDFNAQLREASQGQIQNLDDLSRKDLPALLKENPEIEQVVSTHMQNPDFARLINEIFSNPQFRQSVSQLQGGDVPAQKEPQ